MRSLFFIMFTILSFSSAAIAQDSIALSKGQILSCSVKVRIASEDLQNILPALPTEMYMNLGGETGVSEVPVIGEGLGRASAIMAIVKACDGVSKANHRAKTLCLEEVRKGAFACRKI